MQAFTGTWLQLAIRLRRSAFVRNVMVVMTGTAAAQAIGFAVSPLISRLYSPSDFGVFGAFAAVSGVIAAGATLEYPQAIMLPKSHEDGINLFVVSCVVTAISSMACLVCCLLAPGAAGDLMKSRDFWVVLLLVLATTVNGVNQSCQAWCVRVKAFRQTSASQVVRSLSANGLQLGVGYLGAAAPGLIVGSLLGDTLASLNLVGPVVSDLKTLRRSIGWSRMRELAREYRDFPQYSATMNVMNALSLGLPVLLLTHFYGIAVAGAYAFGIRIVSTPMGFVTRSLRQVLFQKACEVHNEGDRLLPLFLKITSGMFLLALLPALALVAWGPQTFAWVFGAQWHTAGVFVRSLTLWLLFMFCNLPAVLFGRIMRIQRKMFAYDVSILLGRTLVLVLGGSYLSAASTVLLFSLFGAIMNVVVIVVVGRALHAKEGKLDWSQVPDALGVR
jgi:lipopolysaccharide exporter